MEEYFNYQLLKNETFSIFIWELGFQQSESNLG